MLMQQQFLQQQQQSAAGLAAMGFAASMPGLGGVQVVAAPAPAAQSTGQNPVIAAPQDPSAPPGGNAGTDQGDEDDSSDDVKSPEKEEKSPIDADTLRQRHQKGRLSCEADDRRSEASSAG
eukprot:UN2921